MSERLKELRTSLGLSQAEFAKKTNTSQAMIAAFEIGTRNMKEIHISQICSIFNVNPEWLRNGNGSMFVESDTSLLGQLAEKYRLSGVEQTVIASFLSLSEKNRSVILDFVKATVARIVETNADELHPYIGVASTLTDNAISAEVEDYRQELLTEKKATAKSDPSAITGA